MSSENTANEQDNFDKTKMLDDHSSLKDIFNFDKSWTEDDPRTAPLLSATNKSKNYRLQIEEDSRRRQLQQQEQFSREMAAIPENNQAAISYNYFEHWFAAVSLAAMPFHHLIPAAQITSDSVLNSLGANKSISTISHAERLQIFWQSLAINGASAKEAALLDDSLEGYFVQLVDNRLIEVDWEVLYFDELQGCAEIYRAEMLVCKRRIYETGEDLRVVLELTDEDLIPYLNEEVFTLLTDTSPERLFFDSLMSSFNLTISGSTDDDRNGKNSTDKKHKKSQKGISASNPHNINAYRGFGSKRVESWMGREGDELDEAHGHTSETNIYRIRLSDYWLDWQRAARIAMFDFDYLQTLTDARAMRFYELTKLCRVPPDAEEGDKITNKLEIEYEKFVLLMPLPKLSSEREITQQIRQLIKPLKSSGYVKSFRVKTEWRGIASRDTRVVFRFND